MTRLLLAAALGAATLPLIQSRVDASRSHLGVERESLYLWKGEQVRRLFPGFEVLAADIYWLRTVQYFGGQKLFAAEKTYDLLKPLIDITTTLDPRFEIAYRYGAVFLCEPRPVGAGRPEEGLEILEKGVRARPESWRLGQDLGFFRYIYLHDAEAAATTLSEAARVPGAPFWLESMAADILAEGGDRGKARAMWQRMFEQAEPGILKENAKLRLQILDALDQADLVTAGIREFARRTGRNPDRLGELVEAGLWRGKVADPSGTPFEYDQQKGSVEVSRQSPLWRPRKG